MPNFHPMVVHFPIAFLTASCLLDLAGFLLNNSELNRFGWWSLLAGFGGIILAIAAALMGAGTYVVGDAALETYESHQQLALGLAVIYGILAAWRFQQRGELKRNNQVVYLSFSLLALLLLWVTAWQGGELVFTYGIGVSK